MRDSLSHVIVGECPECSKFLKFVTKYRSDMKRPPDFLKVLEENLDHLTKVKHHLR